MIEIARHRALALLSECNGDHIWSLEHCRRVRVPESWITELADRYESGFRSDTETIYVDDRVTNQYEGIRDIDLAIRIGRALKLDIERITASALTRRGIVAAIKTAIMDGDDVE